MKRILPCALVFLAACGGGEQVLLRPLPAAGEPSSEVTVIRPRSIVQAEWPFYIVVADQPVFDLRNGENTRFRMSSGRQALTIRCMSAISDKPIDVRIEENLPPGGAGYFVVEPRSDCVAIRVVGAGEAASDLRTTRFRAVGTVNRAAQATGDAPAVFASTPAAPAVAAPAATAATNTSAAGAAAAWVEAFNSRDEARMASLYDADAVLRDNAGQRLAAGPGAIAAYFRNLKTPPQVSAGEPEVRTFGDTAVVSGSNTLGRYNIVCRNRGGKWLIVDHQTARPAP